jgi:hypothetical protein
MQQIAASRRALRIVGACNAVSLFAYKRTVALLESCYRGQRRRSLTMAPIKEFFERFNALGNMYEQRSRGGESEFIGLRFTLL